MNVYDFAMQMEDSGHDYYLSLADAATLPGLKTIFSELAADEKKHFEVFRALKAGNPTPTVTETKALDNARNIFKSLPRGEEGLKGLGDTLPAYRHAMRLEADSFRFYKDAAAEETDPAVKALLLQIAGEEQKHFDILENVFNFVNAPNQSIEWGEFSNLGEFHQFGRDLDR